MRREMRKLNQAKYAHSEEEVQRLISEGYRSVESEPEADGADGDGQTADPAQGQNGADGDGQTADPAQGQNGADGDGQTADPAQGQNGADGDGQTADPAQGQNGADGDGQTADPARDQDTDAEKQKGKRGAGRK